MIPTFRLLHNLSFTLLNQLCNWKCGGRNQRRSS